MPKYHGNPNFASPDSIDIRSIFPNGVLVQDGDGKFVERCISLDVDTGDAKVYVGSDFAVKDIKVKLPIVLIDRRLRPDVK